MRLCLFCRAEIPAQYLRYIDRNLADGRKEIQMRVNRIKEPPRRVDRIRLNPIRTASTPVKILRIDPSEWFDSDSCKVAIENALRNNGIRLDSNLLFRGTTSKRKDILLERGSDFPPFRTVMATPHLYDPSQEESDCALPYALAFGRKAIVAVYQGLEYSGPEFFVYHLRSDHPTKGLIAIIELPEE